VSTENKKLIETLEYTYLELQKLSNKSISIAIQTDFLRANLRNKICDALDLDCETFQNYIEAKSNEL